jgi:hypothetical protein
VGKLVLTKLADQVLPIINPIAILCPKMKSQTMGFSSSFFFFFFFATDSPVSRFTGNKTKLSTQKQAN